MATGYISGEFFHLRFGNEVLGREADRGLPAEAIPAMVLADPGRAEGRDALLDVAGLAQQLAVALRAGRAPDRRGSPCRHPLA